MKANLTLLIGSLTCILMFLVACGQSKVITKTEGNYINSGNLGTENIVATPLVTSSNANTINSTLLTTTKQKVKPKKSKTKKVIVVDPGHQTKANIEKEPIGPGATTKKAKVTGGTYSKFSGLKEYELCLAVALSLKDRLEEEGYKVIMTREENEVNLINSERAEIANEAKADAFLRIHANGSDNEKANGIMTICPTKKNPYCSEIYKQSRKLSDCILEGMLNKTKANSKGVWETDSMSGINWCKVPVTIIEMGFMTNKKEDQLMSTKKYQDKMVEGIVSGLKEYFKTEQ